MAVRLERSCKYLVVFDKHVQILSRIWTSKTAIALNHTYNICPRKDHNTCLPRWQRPQSKRNLRPLKTHRTRAWNISTTPTDGPKSRSESKRNSKRIKPKWMCVFCLSRISRRSRLCRYCGNVQCIIIGSSTQVYVQQCRDRQETLCYWNRCVCVEDYLLHCLTSIFDRTFGISSFISSQMHHLRTGYEWMYDQIQLWFSMLTIYILPECSAHPKSRGSLDPRSNTRPAVFTPVSVDSNIKSQPTSGNPSPKGPH